MVKKTTTEVIKEVVGQHGVNCDKTGDPIFGIRYHSPYKYESSGSNKLMEANFSEEAMLEGAYPIRSFTPMIFYRLSRPIARTKLTNLPKVSFFGAQISLDNVIPNGVSIPAKLPEFILDQYYQKSRGFSMSVTVSTDLGDTYNPKLI
jgi:hypothetical protein